MRQLSIGAMTAALLLAGCVQQPPPYRMTAPEQSVVPPAPQYAYGPAQARPQPAGQSDAGGYDDGYAAYDDVPQDPSAGVYIDPPLDQPPPIRVEWAPPPLLIENPPPPPYPDAIWTEGYWVWQDNWVWARGRWLAPPRPGYRWMRPYYEHRGDSVIFINGFWAGPGVSFRRPPPTLNIPFARVRPGVARGPRPNGPDGPFMPPPHGARRGTFVPASVPEPQAPRPQERRPQQVDQPDRRAPGGQTSPSPANRSGFTTPNEVNAPPRNADRSFQDRQDRQQNRDQDRGQMQGRDTDRSNDQNRARNQERDAQRRTPQAVTPPQAVQPRPQTAPPRPERSRPDQDENRGPGEHAPRPQPQAQQPQAMPRPQPQAVPHPPAPAPAARPAPQPRPEHRAPPPREQPAERPEPEKHEGGDRGGREH